MFKIPQHEDGLDPFISKHLAEYMLDDVFSQEFLAVVVFIVPRKSCISKEEIKILEENGMKEYIFVSSTDYSPGPHVIVDQELREVWKLVEDSYASCMVTLKPQTGYGLWIHFATRGDYALIYFIFSARRVRWSHFG